MPAVARIFDGGQIHEGSAVTLRAEVSNALTGDMLVTSDVTSWSLRVYDRGADDEEVYVIEGQAPSQIMLDTPQSWANGANGYNVQMQLLPDAWEQQGGRVYLFELTLDLAAGFPEHVCVLVTTVPIRHG